uniref:Myosin, light polypeptide 3, skeletal muscle n=1 Tax=Poecilia latipinna TaxID=48699 RepID=A0A3B3TXQ4_9TELE
QTEFTPDQIEDFKEAFGLFDRIGDSQVAYNQVADIMRALGQNPTNKDVIKILGNPSAEDKCNVNQQTWRSMPFPRDPTMTTLRVCVSLTRRATEPSWVLSCASCCPLWVNLDTYSLLSTVEM